MPTTMGRGAGAGQCEPPRVAHDRHQNAAMHDLAATGFSQTPGGANTKAQRLRADLIEVVRAFHRCSMTEALDRYFAPIDVARLEGEVQLTDAAFTTIERADAEDGVARVRYHGEPNLDHAKLAKAAALKVVRAQLEFIRGLHTAHPELAP